MPFQPVHHYYSYSAGDWVWSIFSTLLFIALIVLAVTLLVRVFGGPRRGAFGHGPVSRAVPGQPAWYGPAPGGPWRAAMQADSGERILAERYARGEIAEDEYLSRLEVLRQAAAGYSGATGFPGPPGASGAAWSAQPPPPEPQQPPSQQEPQP